MRSPNAHIYLKVLRENILDELKLAESAKRSEFEWTKTQEASLNHTYDAESKYNLHHLNNEEAIGYRNLEERAGDIANNKDLAHETVFDKMLADYFLQKRGDYKKGNQLLTKLEAIFGDDTNPSAVKLSGTKLDGKAGARPADRTLGELYLHQTRDKHDRPELLPYNFPALMELDIAVNRQLHGGKGGLSNELKAMPEDEQLHIPEYFEGADVR